MSDKMTINNLKLPCYLGTKPEEQDRKQIIVFNLEMSVDCRPAGISDDLEKSVDYSALTNELAALVNTTHFKLIEHLAEKVSEVCLKNPLVKDVHISITKNGCIAQADSVTIQVFRARD